MNILLCVQSRPSPIGAQTSPNSDYDEFDVISNRAKTQNPNNNNNNNTSNGESFIFKFLFFIVCLIISQI